MTTNIIKGDNDDDDKGDDDGDDGDWLVTTGHLTMSPELSAFLMQGERDQAAAACHDDDGHGDDDHDGGGGDDLLEVSINST